MTTAFEDILAKAEDPAYRRVVTARVQLVEQRLRDEHAELEARLTDLRASDTVSDPDRVAIAKRLAELEADMEANVYEFRFQNIGHRAWYDLLAKHRPTSEQLRADRNLDHNPATFPYAAMAASCIAPEGGTVESFQRLDASGMMDTAGWTELWGACIRANVQDLVPKSLAASILLRSVESSTTAANGESHAASSSAES